MGPILDEMQIRNRCVSLVYGRGLQHVASSPRHIASEVILMILLRILIISKLYLIIAIWKTHSKYSSALIKVIKSLTQAQHVE